MATAKIVDMQGQVVGEQELAPGVFEMPVHQAVLHQVVTAQLWNRRQGNASTLTRAMVSGGNHKPYKQKGTGRARQGSTRAPHYRGGGVVFGPHPHPYHKKVQRQMRRIALRSALSDKAAHERILIVRDLALEAPRTRTMIEFFDTLELTDEVHTPPLVLMLLAERDENVVLSVRNIPYAKVCHVSAINVVELLKHDYLLLTPDALAFIEETFDDGTPAVAAEDEEAE
jgi:large subunit ribosomal protein L4